MKRFKPTGLGSTDQNLERFDVLQERFQIAGLPVLKKPGIPYQHGEIHESVGGDWPIHDSSLESDAEPLKLLQFGGVEPPATRGGEELPDDG